MKPAITKDTVIRRNEGKFLSNKIGDEMVMMDMDSGDYLGINDVGLSIWDLLSEPRSVQALMDEILTV